MMTRAPLFTRARFWSADRCARIRAAIDGGTPAPAEIFDGGYRVDERVRRSFEVEVDPLVVRDVEQDIRDLRSSLSRFFDVPLQTSEGPGFLRYPAGGFYGAHRDCLPDTEDAFPRRIAIVLFLSECEGGSLVVWPSSDDEARGSPSAVAPAVGMLVAFPATWLHEVRPVSRGVRDAIVDWFY